MEKPTRNFGALPALPAPVVELATRFRDDWEEVYWLIPVVETSLVQLHASLPLFEAIQKALGETGDDAALQLKQVNEYAERAKKEMASGFQRLRALAVIAMWSRLEAFIKDMLVCCANTGEPWFDRSFT